MAHKLTARLNKIENKKEEHPTYPDLSFWYMSEAEQRSWFDKHGRNYEEYLKCAQSLELKLANNHIN